MFPFLLLPRFFKVIGIALVISGFVLGHYTKPNFDSVKDGTGLAVQCMVLFGLLFVACSRQKVEDEMIRHMRLTSLQYAVIIFVLIRFFFKLVGYYAQDESWMPQHQSNFLLMLYIGMFYMQAVVEPWVLDLVSKGGNR